jgi:outer membrane immunogenic protein
MMKKLLLASVAVAAIATAGSAGAADFPVYKAPPPIACPTCNWNGFYIGANAGGSIAVNSETSSVSVTPFFNPLVSTSSDRATAGGIWGGQIGYNWQAGGWLLAVRPTGIGPASVAQRVA